MVQKIDRRKRYTRMALKNSLMELLKEKPVSSITIKEICEHADINRSTFYSHYADQYDLMTHIEDEIIDELNQALLQYDYTQEKEALAMLKYLLEYVYSRHEHFRILFSEHGNKRFTYKVMFAAQTHIMNDFNGPEHKMSETAAKYMTIYSISGSITVIEYWLENGMKESTDEMAKIISEISKPC
ncbi:TetR/AcrR family transcriptional regulator [Oceanobacillus neutriphilus]|uniref:TetR family transcriptional regulator n=1 Tax=Oceanobacillus neutriphilus TaxID=531815 RepID=A0ABQ2NXG1_9BACI|nr:TetR-like C-terminal domain-containing protein [Oceanobacillus neutriphilus]GGP12959.1 TetR family transcriptional regulator [Oceanobacillus neutriphilus]